MVVNLDKAQTKERQIVEEEKNQLQDSQESYFSNEAKNTFNKELDKLKKLSYSEISLDKEDLFLGFNEETLTSLVLLHSQYSAICT